MTEAPVLFITGNRDGLVTTKRVRQYLDKYGSQIPLGVPCEKVILESGATHIDNREEDVVFKACSFLKKYLDRHRIETTKLDARIWNMNRYRRFKPTKLKPWKEKQSSPSKTTLIDPKQDSQSKQSAINSIVHADRIKLTTPIYSSSRLKGSFSGSDSRPRANSRVEVEDRDVKPISQVDKDYYNAHSSTKSSDEINPHKAPQGMAQNHVDPLGIDPWAMLNQPQKGTRRPPVDDSLAHWVMVPPEPRGVSQTPGSPKGTEATQGLKLSRGLGGFGGHNPPLALRSPDPSGHSPNQVNLKHPSLSHLDHFANPYNKPGIGSSADPRLGMQGMVQQPPPSPTNTRSAYGVLASYQGANNPPPGYGYQAQGYSEPIPMDPRQHRLQNQQTYAAHQPQATQLHPERFDDEDLSVFLDERYNAMQGKDMIMNGTMNLDDSMLQDLNQLNVMLKAKPQPAPRYR